MASYLLNTACICSVEGSCRLNVLTSGVSFAYGKLASDFAKYDVSGRYGNIDIAMYIYIICSSYWYITKLVSGVKRYKDVC